MQKRILLLIVLSTTLLFSSESLAQTRTRSVDKDAGNTPDPVVILREQLAATTEVPERNRLQLQLAELLQSTDRKSEAIAELNKIASSKAFDPVSFYNLGNAFARLGESESAIAAYRIAIEQRKGLYSRAYNNLGVLLLRAGKWDEAQEAFLSALKLESFRYAEASYNLGRVYAAKGQNDLAAREWRRALAVDPQHDAAKQALANEGRGDRIVVVSNKAGKSSTAAAGPSAAARPLELDQASFDYLQRAREASERGKKSEAADSYRRLLSRNNGYFPPANLELGYALVSLKQYDEALANLLEVTKRDGARYPVSYYHLARLYEMKGELKLAEAAFVKAVSLYAPANPQFLLDLSRVREKLGDFNGSLEAMESYTKVMQEHGQKPSWSEERIAELRSKATKQD
ncbi:MAG TPA: tetratricopeptide repeat protein [Pyrinomonadaceae bacterium]|nr:tetratricopeptide repeat protein [Pyrinomonadaceae bacterium]